MLKLLVPVEEAKRPVRVVEYLIPWLERLNDPVEIHLINVQRPLHGEIGLFISCDQIRQYHHDEGLKALAAAREQLDAAGLAYRYHVGVGDPATVIAHYAKEQGCDQIVMATRGLGHIASVLLGSVTTRIIQLSEVPVLLVK